MRGDLQEIVWDMCLSEEVSSHLECSLIKVLHTHEVDILYGNVILLEIENLSSSQGL